MPGCGDSKTRNTFREPGSIEESLGSIVLFETEVFFFDSKHVSVGSRHEYYRSLTFVGFPGLLSVPPRRLSRRYVVSQCVGTVTVPRLTGLHPCVWTPWSPLLRGATRTPRVISVGPRDTVRTHVWEDPAIGPRTETHPYSWDSDPKPIDRTVVPHTVSHYGPFPSRSRAVV